MMHGETVRNMLSVLQWNKFETLIHLVGFSIEIKVTSQQSPLLRQHKVNQSFFLIYVYTSSIQRRVRTNYAALLWVDVDQPCVKRWQVLWDGPICRPRSPTDCLSVWAWFRKRPHQRSQDSNLAVRPRRETVMTVRDGTMWPSNSHQSQTGVSSVWQTPLWNKLIFHQMKEQTFLSLVM